LRPDYRYLVLFGQHPAILVAPRANLGELACSLLHLGQSNHKSARQEGLTGKILPKQILDIMRKISLLCELPAKKPLTGRLPKVLGLVKGYANDKRFSTAKNCENF